MLIVKKIQRKSKCNNFALLNIGTLHSEQFGKPICETDITLRLQTKTYYNECKPKNLTYHKFKHLKN